jgi:peptidoglycan/xylan/chitin deacetylase (PgdA/CDA1 family)
VQTDNLIALYHYVRPQNSDGVTGITPDTFSGQVELIRSRYRVVTIEEFVETRHEQTGIALITFDDAVSDQYDYAFPILEDHGVPGVVFAPMRPYSDETDRWSTQHLLHALAQHLGWGQLEKRVDAAVGHVSVDEETMNRLYHYEVPAKRRLKYLLAFTLDQQTVRETLNDVNSSVGLSPDDWFMSAAQLREMQSAGHGIGGHGFDHVPYNTLSPKAQAADMHRAQLTMTRCCGAMARAMAYPDGRRTPETDAIARGCGYTFCLDTDSRVDAKYLEDHLRRTA